eukprot:2601486-Rhodomonas_salina.1
MALLLSVLYGPHFWFSAPLLALRARSLGSVICSLSFLDGLQSGLLFGGTGGLKSQCSGSQAGYFGTAYILLELDSGTGGASLSRLNVAGTCMAARKEKLRLLEESESDSDSGRRSSCSRGSSMDRSTTKSTPQSKDKMDKESTESMNTIAEVMGEASLISPESQAAAKTAANPVDTQPEEKEEAAKSRAEEIESIQSRLPFVPRHPFSLEGVTDSERCIPLSIRDEFLVSSC